MIQVIQRVFDILSILREAGPLPLKTITERATLQKSTCHNILKSLAELDIVNCPKPGIYQIGRGLERLTGLSVRDEILAEKASIHVERLAKTCGETVILGILRDVTVKVLYAVEGGMEVVVRADAHRNGSLYRWATGRLLLSHQPPAAISGIISRLGLPSIQDWPSVKGNRKNFLTQLAEIRGKEILERSEGKAGLVSLACPILDSEGRVIAALGVSIPAYRAAEKTPEISTLLLAVSEDITQELKPLD